jgi:hypothetical protein
MEPDRALHVVHAFAEFIAATVLEPAYIVDIPYAVEGVHDLFTLNVNTNAYIKSIVDIIGNPNSLQMVCAKNTMGAHDLRSLERAIWKAGTTGICRGEIGGQYRLAYMDLATLLKTDSVFATTYRVWHRTVAGTINPRLRAAAQAAGII